MGQRLGRFITAYRNNYFQPDKRNGQVIFSNKPLPGEEQAVYKQIGDITISMKSTAYLPMPELISSEYTVHLSDAEADRFEELKQKLVLQLSDGEITAANAASLSNKLCQMANAPFTTTAVRSSRCMTRSWMPWKTLSKRLVGNLCWWPTDTSMT